MAFVFGLTFSFWRIGSILAFFVLPKISEMYSHETALFCIFVCCTICFGLSCIIPFIEAKWHFLNPNLAKPISTLDNSESLLSNIYKLTRRNNNQPSSKLIPPENDIQSLWTLICIGTIFYCCFITFSNFFVRVTTVKWNMDVVSAAQFASFVHFTAMLIVPIVGSFIDRTGRICEFLIFGNFIFTATLAMFASVEFHPIVPILFLTASYCIVPSVIWPALNLVVSENLVGTASN